jgi:uncharacterized coiled-coil protein SlyX
MMTETSIDREIAILESKIFSAEYHIEAINVEQRKILSEMSDCGLWSHFQQLELKLASNAKLIIAHNLTIKKHQKELQKWKDFMLHLQKKKEHG